MTNPTLLTLETRRSCRNFKPDMPSEEEIEAEEEAFSALIGTAVTAYTAENDQPVEDVDLSVES